jgi:hypothetical protein
VPVMETTRTPGLPAEIYEQNTPSTRSAPRRAGPQRKRESPRLVPTETARDSTLGGISPDFQWMLDSLDERIQAFEMSEEYYVGLTGAEYLALHETVTRNGIPLRLL